MSNTRTRDEEGDSFSYERYMSAPQIVSRRGLLGNAVAAKAMLYGAARIRELLFFLQARSLVAGGMRAVAADLVENCPKLFKSENLRTQIEAAVPSRNKAAHDFAEFQSGFSGGKKRNHATVFCDYLEQFLTLLCLDPAYDLESCLNPEADSGTGDHGSFAAVIDELQRFREAIGFRDVDATFCETSISREIHATLEHGRKRGRGIVVIEGDPGLGKSKAAKVWVGANLGSVRLVSLTGITSKTQFFQRIAAAIGLATCQRKAVELQWSIERFFATTGIGLVFDEAHHLWPPDGRSKSSPELIDWIDTALVNSGVTVALICTDQFSRLKERVEKVTDWAGDQFIHRVRRFCRLPKRPSKNDLERVTSWLLPWHRNPTSGDWQPASGTPDRNTRDLVVAFALTSYQPLSAVLDAIEEARLLAEERNEGVVTFEDVRKAVEDVLLPSAVAMRESFQPKTGLRKKDRPNGRGSSPTKAFISTPIAEDESRQASPARLSQVSGSRTRNGDFQLIQTPH